MANAPKNTAVESLQRQIRELEKQRAALEAQLEALLQQQPSVRSASPTERALLPKEKIALFRRFFAGRPDVFALRWENTKDGRFGYAPACSNEWVAGICGKPKIKCGVCPNQAFIPVTDESIKRHLRGSSSSNGSPRFRHGRLSLIADDTCWFLAAGFRRRALGRRCSSVSGNVQRTWCTRRTRTLAIRCKAATSGYSLLQPIAARDARQLGAALMTETMERRPEIGFASYDRLFPNQDSMPAGGFGNLIALPLARRCSRSRQQRLRQRQTRAVRGSVGVPRFTAANGARCRLDVG